METKGVKKIKMLFYILLFTFLASIISLFLVAILLLHRSLIKKISFSLVSFAAGALLATGFLDTMPEAVRGSENAYLFITLSIAAFFLVERLFITLHHHDQEDLSMPTPFLLFGDALHNFIDGMSIAATFLVSFSLGVVTSAAVFIHEIPHELGDFGILVHKGWGRKEVFLFNLGTGLAAIIGALLAFFLGKQFENVVPFLLAVTTGNFIYLSATDLLPEIHHKAQKNSALNYMIFFLLGILVIYLLEKILKA